MKDFDWDDVKGILLVILFLLVITGIPQLASYLQEQKAQKEARIMRAMPNIVLSLSESSEYRIALSDFAIGKDKGLKTFVSRIYKEGKYGRIQLPDNFSSMEVIKFGGKYIVAPAK